MIKWNVYINRAGSKRDLTVQTYCCNCTIVLDYSVLQCVDVFVLVEHLHTHMHTCYITLPITACIDITLFNNNNNMNFENLLNKL